MPLEKNTIYVWDQYKDEEIIFVKESRSNGDEDEKPRKKRAVKPAGQDGEGGPAPQPVNPEGQDGEEGPEHVGTLSLKVPKPNRDMFLQNQRARAPAKPAKPAEKPQKPVSARAAAKCTAPESHSEEEEDPVNMEADLLQAQLSLMSVGMNLRSQGTGALDEDPTDTEETVIPKKRARSVEPAEPAKSAEPAEPAEPVLPKPNTGRVKSVATVKVTAEQVEPVKPAKKPEDTAKPAKPAKKPEDTAKQVKPAEPAKKPEDTAKQVKPAEPAKKPEDTEPGDADTHEDDGNTGGVDASPQTRGKNVKTTWMDHMVNHGVAHDQGLRTITSRYTWSVSKESMNLGSKWDEISKKPWCGTTAVTGKPFTTVFDLLERNMLQLKENDDETCTPEEIVDIATDAMRETSKTLTDTPEFIDNFVNMKVMDGVFDCDMKLEEIGHDLANEMNHPLTFWSAVRVFVLKTDDDKTAKNWGVRIWKQNSKTLELECPKSKYSRVQTFEDKRLLRPNVINVLASYNEANGDNYWYYTLLEFPDQTKDAGDSQAADA